MRVRVLFFGPLKDITGTAEEQLDIAGGSSLGELLDHYASRFPRISEMRASVKLARNREFAAPEQALADGDEVAFLPPVSGGSPAEPGGAPLRPQQVVALVRTTIDSRNIAEQLLAGEDGAVVVFDGVVRNHSSGRRTLYLEYEAYEPMALERMTALANEAREQWQIDRIGIVHRLGRLEIGQTSVAIVVTAAHRGPAFDACRATIDRLKKEVPIWKKEYFEDGAVWVEGEWGKA